MKTQTMTMAAALLVAMSAAVWTAPAESAAVNTAANFETRCCGYRDGGDQRGWCGDDRGDRPRQGRGYCYDGGTGNN